MIRRRRFIAVLIVTILVTTTAVAAAPPVAKLVINYGDGCEKHFTMLPIKEGTTGLELLQAAEKHKRGIKMEHRGSGSTAMVTKIDDVKNEGGGSTARNWQFWVNGKRGEASIGLVKLKPDDVITWKFEILLPDEG